MIALSLRDFFENNDDLREKLKKSKKPVFLYGTGNGADKVIDDFNNRGIKISGVFVSDGFCRDRTFRGFKVKTFADIQSENAEFIAALRQAAGKTDEPRISSRPHWLAAGLCQPSPGVTNSK